MARQRVIYGRKTQVKEVRKKILIVTEGKTEKEYFDQYKRMPSITVLTYDAGDNKRSLVEKTIEYRDQLVVQGKIEAEDSVWAVFDRDIDGRNPSDTDNFNQALQVAENANINVAYSNDSVELWFLVHFQDVSTSLHRKDINAKLSAHLGFTYKKAQGKQMYQLIKAYRMDAVKRCIAMQKNMKGVAPADANPSTTVHLLVNEIMSSGFREKK